MSATLSDSTQLVFFSRLEASLSNWMKSPGESSPGYNKPLNVKFNIEIEFTRALLMKCIVSMSFFFDIECLLRGSFFSSVRFMLSSIFSNSVRTSLSVIRATKSWSSPPPIGDFDPFSDPPPIEDFDPFSDPPPPPLTSFYHTSQL